MRKIQPLVNISKVCDGTGAAGYAQNAAGYAQNAAGYATDAAGYAQFCQIIIPLRGPSCKLRLSRFSAKLKFQDGPSVAKRKKVSNKKMGGSFSM